MGTKWMSSMIAIVSQIESCETLHIVKFECGEDELSMMSLELDERVRVGTKVKLVTKPTHIAIAKNFQGELSYSNKIPVVIDSINNGELLTSIKLKSKQSSFESIITCSSSKRMSLQVGDNVLALIKASELSIGEILDD